METKEELLKQKQEIEDKLANLENTKKYELTTETKVIGDITLFRIRALKSFGSISAGDYGGYIEKESNLSQEGNAWVSGNVMVSGRFDLSVDCDFDLPRINIDTTEKLNKLKKFLEEFDN